MTDPVPAQIRATFGSEAWWATHLAALLAFVVAIITVVHPAWLKETSAAQAWVAPVALLVAGLCVIGYLVFALLHHKISRQTFVADVEAEIPGLRQAATVLLPLVDQVPALKGAIDTVSTDIAGVKASLAAQPAAPDVGALVRAELAKLALIPTASPPGAAG
jgi:hypothetical protein